jgi:hypothetical protein
LIERVRAAKWRLGSFSPEIPDVRKSTGLLAVFLALASSTVLAQNPKSAVGGDSSLWAGGEFSYYDPDYSCGGSSVFTCSADMAGIGALVDFNLTPKIGAEGEARWLHWNGAGGQVESTYLAGPRYRIFRRNRFSFWGKFVAGGGWITTPDYPAAGSLKGSYFVYAPGATVDYRLKYHWALKVDYEYQFWPSFQGPATCNTAGVCVSHNGGLTPNGISVGVMYKFLGQ